MGMEKVNATTVSVDAPVPPRQVYSLDQINQQIDLAQYQVQAAQTVFNLATTLVMPSLVAQSIAGSLCFTVYFGLITIPYFLHFLLFQPFQFVHRLYLIYL